MNLLKWQFGYMRQTFDYEMECAMTSASNNEAEQLEGPCPTYTCM